MSNLDVSTQKFLLKSDELASEENNLKGLLLNELFNRFEIGKVLWKIKEKKLYQYKDAEDVLSWRSWAEQVVGSRKTAERYIGLWYVFVNKYGYKREELEKVQPSYLYEIAPMLSSGEMKGRKEVDELLLKAKEAPTFKEFKQTLKQDGYSVEELNDPEGHKHILQHAHFVRCTICEATRKCMCIKSKEEEHL